MTMGILEIIGTVLTFAIQLFNNRNSPQQAKLRAAAAITSNMNANEDQFNKDLAAGNADAIAAHFQMLSDQSRKLLQGVNIQP